MNFLTATQSTWFLIGPIAWVLGHLMNWIFEFLNLIGLPNIGVAIILFTLVIKALMIPLSIRQQKYSKLQAIIQPEVKKIQDKYKDKRDNASVMAMQQETKEVYAKYGTSATGGCLQTLLQMPILFALYQVIYHMPGYITKLKEYFQSIALTLQKIPNYATNPDLLALFDANKIQRKNATLENTDHIIDMMYNFNPEEWKTFHNIFPDHPELYEAYSAVSDKIDRVNMFLGINLTMTPMQQLWPAIFIPILAGGLQWLSSYLMQKGNGTQKKGQDQQQSMMNTMNIMFPILSVVMTFMFSAGLGLYWVASSGIQVIIQLIVNRYMDKVDLNDMVAKNIEKLNVKRAKKGLPPKKVTDVTMSVRNLEEEREEEERKKKELAERAKESSNYYQSSSRGKPGSLASKVYMVEQYEERQRELKSGKKNAKQTENNDTAEGKE